MSYAGDFAAGQTVRCPFNTTTAAGAPVTLGGTAVAKVYKDGGTTEVTTGVTLTVDFDGVTGLHHAVVDLSSDGTFYAAGSDFSVILTAGTVDGTSVVGACVGTFSIENRCQKADVRKWIGTAVPTPDTAGYPKVTQKVGAGAGEVNLSGGKVPATVAAGDIATDAITAASVKADAVTKIQAGLSTYAGADTSGTTTLLSRLTSTRAGLLDNLDAAISTRSTYAGGAVASVTGNVGGNVVGSVGSVTGAVGSVTGNVGGSVASVTAGVTVTTNNDKAGYSLSVSPPTAAAIADAVWDEAQSGHLTAGTFGAYLDASVSGVSTGGVSAADIADAVLDEALSGHATAGSLGKAVADILDDTGTSGVAVASGSKTGYALTSAYDPAKTAAQAGDAMALTTSERSSVGAAVWASGTRTLSAFAFTVDTNANATETAIKAKTDNLPADPAGLSALATAHGSGSWATATGFSTLDATAVQTAAAAAITAYGPATAANVKSKVVEALSTDTYAEPASVPAATASLTAKLGWLFGLARNKRTQTSDTETLYAGDGTTAVATSAKTDDGATFTRGEWS